jgi:hypothetical protein
MTPPRRSSIPQSAAWPTPPAPSPWPFPQPLTNGTRSTLSASQVRGSQRPPLHLLARTFQFQREYARIILSFPSRAHNQSHLSGSQQLVNESRPQVKDTPKSISMLSIPSFLSSPASSRILSLSSSPIAPLALSTSSLAAWYPTPPPTSRSTPCTSSPSPTWDQTEQLKWPPCVSSSSATPHPHHPYPPGHP